LGSDLCSKLGFFYAQSFFFTSRSKVYTSDPWYVTANAMIRNLKIDNDLNADMWSKPMPLVKDHLYGTFATLYKEWKLSLEIMPFGTISGWSNIIHSGLGPNYGASRV